MSPWRPLALVTALGALAACSKDKTVEPPA
jgi:hypothetical protein